MHRTQPDPDELRSEIERLHKRLEEADELIAAIRDQRVDAFVVESPDGKRVYAIEGADRPYRLLVESMHQGALTLDENGLILFCNARFAELLGVRPEKVIASHLCDHVSAADRPSCDALMRKAPAQAEMRLQTARGNELPVYVSFEVLPHEGGASFGAIVTDLSEQIAHKHLVAAEDLARSILEQAVDAIVVCDSRGTVVRCNHAARELCGRNPLWDRFESVFPLRVVGGDGASPLEAALQGSTQRGVKARLGAPDCPSTDVLLNVGPLRGPAGDVIGVVVTINDLSEHQQLLASEQAARAEAERANRAKDDFVATLSHELRTPLNAILGWAHLLRNQVGDKGEIAEGLEVIERNGRVQAQLISDLLDTSRMMSGKLRLELQSVDARDVVEAAVQSVMPAIEVKRLELVRSYDAAPTALTCDPARLQQVVWNLLSNAAKFTPARGRIEVALRRDGDELEITVRDNGPGIAPDFLPHLFERFRQADSGAARRTGGLGLGLAIVKQLVELHGGTVHAESDGEDRGSTFTVRLPIREHDLVTRPRDLRPMQLDSHSFADLCVLMVDDERDARELVKRVLEEYGARVLTGASVDEAARLLEENQPDLVISDIGMPDRDGYEVPRLVRGVHTSRGAVLPAIALTAFTRDADRARALEVGFQAHLRKPINVAELVSMVAQLTQR